MCQEKQQQQLQAFIDKVLAESGAEIDPNDSERSLEDDIMETQDYNTDTDQEAEIEDEPVDLPVSDEPVQRLFRVPSFIGKDRKTRWKKRCA